MVIHANQPCKTQLAAQRKRLTISQRGRQLAIFSHHLATLLNAGMSLAQALQALGEQTEDPDFLSVLEVVTSRVYAGWSLSQALAEFPRVFPTLFVALIQVGETTGVLVDSVGHLARMLDKQEQLSQKVRSALTYPLFVLTLTVVLTLVMFRFVLPTFVDLFSSAGATLPLPTRVVLGVTRLVGTFWFWPVTLLAFFGGFRLLRKLWSQPARRLVLYRLLLAVPLLGGILHYSALARYCWVMQLSLQTGLGLLPCLALAADASNSPLLQSDAGPVRLHIRAGEDLSGHFRSHPEIYPPLLCQMAALGEEAAEPSSAFGHAATWFEEELAMHIEIFKGALEPFLMVVVALIVGGVMMAIFLPLYGMLDQLS